MTAYEKQILDKIIIVPIDNKESYECDNLPSPFENLSIEELEYLEKHEDFRKSIVCH